MKKKCTAHPPGEANFDTQFVCPKCSSRIKNRSCINCSFAIRQDSNDIFRMTSNKDFYYREKMPKDSLIKINQSEDILKTCYQVFKNELKWKYDFYSFESNRGIGAILCNIGKNSSVLDYGSGWGNITKFMSHYVDKVYSMDLTYESLHFCKRTAPNKNIYYFHGGDERYLPFVENTFDLVFLNGVLEWIPEYLKEGKPRDVQIDFLKKIKKVLKPDGQLIIGIEHRYGYKYFMGKRDEHTGLLFGTILPRGVSDFISKRIKGKPYRTYTYSVSGYRKLLENAGFSDVGIDVPHPDYREISNLIVSESKNKQKKYLISNSSIREKLKYSIELEKKTAHSFLIRSNSTQKSFVEKILGYKNESFSNLDCIKNQRNKCTVLILTDSYVYKIPTTVSASNNLLRETKAVRELHENRDLKRFLPFMESMNIGTMNVQISKRLVPYSVDKKYNLDDFFITKNIFVQEKKYADIFKLNNIRTFMGFNGANALFNKFIDFFGNRSVGCCFLHGDLHSDNIINTMSGIKIIDWEFYSSLGPPLIDIFNLIIFEETFITKRRYYDLAKELVDGKLSISKENRFIKYSSQLNLANPEDIVLYFLFYFDRLLGRLENVSFIPFSMNRKYVSIIDLLEGFVSK